MQTRMHRFFAAAYDPMTRSLERAVLGEHRARLLANLDGQVLDVGAGTGANLPHLRGAPAWSRPSRTPPCAGGWLPGQPRHSCLSR